MSVVVKTSEKDALIAAIKKAIDNKEITTWDYDKDGDFTHNPPQWNKKAWLRPKDHTGGVRFEVIYPNPRDKTKDKLYSGVYQGRFTEMLVVHFVDSFTEIIVTVP